MLLPPEQNRVVIRGFPLGESAHVRVWGGGIEGDATAKVTGDVRLTVDVHQIPTVRYQVQVVDSAGQPLSGVGVAFSAEDFASLCVRTDEKGGTTVSAGKYLNDRTYVTIEKGEKPGSGKATINLNVGKGVKLRGEANDSGEAKTGIFYEREY